MLLLVDTWSPAGEHDDIEFQRPVVHCNTPRRFCVILSPSSQCKARDRETLQDPTLPGARP